MFLLKLKLIGCLNSRRQSHVGQSYRAREPRCVWRMTTRVSTFASARAATRETLRLAHVKTSTSAALPTTTRPAASTLSARTCLVATSASVHLDSTATLSLSVKVCTWCSFHFGDFCLGQLIHANEPCIQFISFNISLCCLKMLTFCIKDIFWKLAEMCDFKHSQEVIKKDYQTVCYQELSFVKDFL